MRNGERVDRIICRDANRNKREEDLTGGIASGTTTN